MVHYKIWYILTTLLTQWPFVRLPRVDGGIWCFLAHPIVRRSVANSASRAMGRSPNMTAQQAHDGGAMILGPYSQHHAGVSIHPHHRSAWTRLSSRPIHDHTGLFMSGYAEPLVNSTLVHCGGSSECGYVLRTQVRRALVQRS